MMITTNSPLGPQPSLEMCREQYSVFVQRHNLSTRSLEIQTQMQHGEGRMGVHETQRLLSCYWSKWFSKIADLLNFAVIGRFFLTVYQEEGILSTIMQIFIPSRWRGMFSPSSHQPWLFLDTHSTKEILSEVISKQYGSVKIVKHFQYPIAYFFFLIYKGNPTDETSNCRYFLLFLHL